jgi:uncharacterized protein
VIDALAIDLRSVVADVLHARVQDDVERLRGVLDEAQSGSVLPDAPVGCDALRDFVVRVRLEG